MIVWVGDFGSYHGMCACCVFFVCHVTYEYEVVIAMTSRPLGTAHVGSSDIVAGALHAHMQRVMLDDGMLASGIRSVF